MSYVYVTSEKAGKGGATNDLFTVGFYDPAGQWQPESDHGTVREAADRVAFLNGGADAVAAQVIVLRQQVGAARLALRNIEAAGYAGTPSNDPEHLRKALTRLTEKMDQCRAWAGQVLNMIGRQP